MNGRNTTLAIFTVRVGGSWIIEILRSALTPSRGGQPASAHQQHMNSDRNRPRQILIEIFHEESRSK
jgi:hypothetical protein